MLELITSSNEQLVLDPSTKVRLSIPFPISVDSTDGIPASVSYPFNLPDDDAGINRRLIQASPLIDEAAKISRVGIRIVFAGYQIDSGYLICTGFSAGMFRCTLVCSPFIVDLGETQLAALAEFTAKIELGATSADIAAEAVNRNTQEYPATPVVFPTIYAPDFYGGANDDFNGLLNRYKDGTIPINEIVKQYEDGDPIDGDYLTNEDSLYPCFFASWMLQKVFESNGYKVLGSVFSDTFFRRLLIGAKKAADAGRYECHLNGVIDGYTDVGISDLRRFNIAPTDHGADMSLNGSYPYLIQIVDKGYYEITVTAKFAYVTGVRNLLMEVSTDGEAELYHEWFNSVAEDETEQTISASFWRGGPGWIMVSCNKNWQPISGSIKVRGTSQETLNRFDGAIIPGKYFADVTAANLINAIKMLTGIGIFYDKVSRVAEVITANEVLASNQALDITDWVTASERNQDEPVGMRIDYKRKSEKFPYINSLASHFANPFNLPQPKANDEAVVDNMLSVIRASDSDGLLAWQPAGTTMNKVTLQGRTYEDYNPEIEPLISIFRDVLGLVVPYYAENGASTHFSATGDMPLMILIWHGLRAAKDGSLYPYASSSGMAPDGEELTPFSLQMDGDRGVYERYLSGLLSLKQNNATVKTDIILSLDRLIALLELFKPTTIGEEPPPRKVAIQSVEMLPSSLDVELSMNGIEAAQITLTQQLFK